MRRDRLVVLTLCLAMLATAASASSQPRDVIRRSPNGRYVVGLRAAPTAPLLQQLIAAGVRGVTPLTTVNAVIAEASTATMDVISRWTDVTYVEGDAAAHFTTIKRPSRPVKEGSAVARRRSRSR